MITGYVHGQSLRLSAPTVASSTVDYLEAQFIFRQRDWDGLSVIKAVFAQGEEVYTIPLTDGYIRQEDHLNLSAGIWSVHLVGSAYAEGEIVRRITTAVDHLTVVQTGAVDGEPLPEVPATAVERLEAAIEELRQNCGGTDKYVSDYRIETIGFPGRSYIVLIYSDESELKIELPQMGIDIDDVIQLGTSDPTGNTSGATKQLYINTSTGKVWVCKNGLMRPVQWVSLSGGKTEIIDDGGTVTVKFGG